MTLRSLVALTCVATLGVVGCGKDTPTTPTPAAAPKFTAILLPSNEVPAITNADAAASGTVTITLNTTKDAAGTITAATADFSATLSAFPAGTTITAAHIHTGAAGATGGVVWNVGLASGEVAITNGAGAVTKLAVAPADVATAQAIINNPAGFYFNVHTSLNTGGAVRGQLVRAN